MTVPNDEQPIPRHHLDRKSVWNDKLGRTLVVFDILENGTEYKIEFLLINGKKPLQFVTVPWMDVYQSISKKIMQRAFI